MATVYAYPIERTHDDSPFLIQPYSIDGPANPFTTSLFSDGTRSATSANTSLILVGKGVPDYGEFIHQNFVNLMQNFAHATPPTYALPGQLWYQPSSQTLSIYSGSAWTIVSEPATTVVNDLNSLSDVIITAPNIDQYLTYDGTNWINAAFNNILQIDRLSPANNDFLTYNSGWINRSPAQVRNILGVSTTSQNNTLYLLADGGSLVSNLSANSNKIVNLANPTSLQDAATKSYVDTAASAQPFIFTKQYNYHNQGTNVSTLSSGLMALDRITSNNADQDQIYYTYLGTSGQNWIFSSSVTGTANYSQTTDLTFQTPQYIGGKDQLTNEIQNTDGTIFQLRPKILSRCVAVLNPTSPGSTVLVFSPSITPNATTGLTSGTVYTYIISSRTGSTAITINGSSAQTFDALVSQFNTALNGAATAAIVSGAIIITSSGNLVEISRDPALTSNDLFASLIGFNKFNVSEASSPNLGTPAGLLSTNNYSFTITYRGGLSESINVAGALVVTYNDLVDTINSKLRATNVAFKNSKLIFQCVNEDIVSIGGTLLASLPLFAVLNPPSAAVRYFPITEPISRYRISDRVLVDTIFIAEAISTGLMQIGSRISFTVRGTG